MKHIIGYLLYHTPRVQHEVRLVICLVRSVHVVRFKL